MPLMFRSSVVTIKRFITDLMSVYKLMFDGHLVWPAVNEDGPIGQASICGGTIYGTSYENYSPMIEPQRLNYSGNRLYNAIHTQVIVDNTGLIRCVESGFMGHQNDAQQFVLMVNIGTDLPFACRLFSFR